MNNRKSEIFIRNITESNNQIYRIWSEYTTEKVPLVNPSGWGVNLHCFSMVLPRTKKPNIYPKYNYLTKKEGKSKIAPEN